MGETNLDVALFAVVGVVALEQFALDKLLERIDQVVALDGQVERQEDLLALVAVWTLLADHLVAEDAAQDVVEELVALHLVQVLVDAVYQVGEELERVLLLAHVHRLAAQTQAAPKLVRHEVLQLRVLQVADHHLELEKERLLVGVLVIDG